MMTLEIRYARPGDRETILAFCAHIWDGGDYLPRVWEEWLHDPAGPLIVALLAGRPVAVDKITLQSPDEAWLGGMRVDPAYQGQGIAGTVTAHGLRWLAARHVPIARFTTASGNVAVHRIATQLGFRLVMSVRRFVHLLIDSPAEALPRRLDPGEEGRAWEMLSGSEFLRATGGLLGRGWIWSRFNRDRLREHLRRGEVLAWGAGPDALGIVVDSCEPRALRRLILLVGERAAGLALVRALLCEPDLVVEDAENPPQFRLTVPEGLADLEWIVEQAGLELHWDQSMCLFERNAGEDSP